jgi:hypothetical protein
MDPKASDTASVSATTGAEATKPRKSRPAIDIDLPASAVRDESSETTVRDDQAPANPPAPRAKTPIFVPSLLGFLAGAIGGFGAWHVTGTMDGGAAKMTAGLEQRLGRLEQNRPTLPAEVTERLTRAERALTEAQPREQALRAELGQLRAAIASEQAERTKALAALGDRGGSPTASSPGPVEPPAPRLDTLQAQIDGVSPKLNSVAEQVATLSKSLGNVAGRDDLSRASAMLVVTGLLGEAFQRNEPLGGILETLRAMGIGEPELAPLTPFAATGPAAPAALLAELRALAAKTPGEAPEGAFFDRLRASAANLVDIRRTGEITGTDDAAHLARAEQALQRGDVATALTLVERLTPARAETFTAWRMKAGQRIKAIEAIGKLRADSLTRLSRAASGAK